MEIKDIQKPKIKGVVVTARITAEDKKFIDKNNINLGELIRKSLNNIKEVQQNVTQNQDVMDEIHQEDES
jgi:hypothetical protein